MRGILIGALAACTVCVPGIALSQNPYRWYYSSSTTRETLRTAPEERQTPSETISVTKRGEQFEIVRTRRKLDRWAGPSVGFDVFLRESGTGKYVTGFVPGIGYGLKWGRASADPDKEPTAYFAIDLFVQGTQSEEDDAHEGKDFFNIDILPVATFFNWVSLGFGPRIKSGLDGHKSENRWVFTFGVKKAP